MKPKILKEEIGKNKWAVSFSSKHKGCVSTFDKRGALYTCKEKSLKGLVSRMEFPQLFFDEAQADHHIEKTLKPYLKEEGDIIMATKKAKKSKTVAKKKAAKKTGGKKGAAGRKPAADLDSKISLVKSAKLPNMRGVREQCFKLLKDGMTIKKALEAAVKSKLTEAQMRGNLRAFGIYGLIKVK